MEVNMTTQEITRLNQTVIDAWNSHDAEKFLALCDKNVVWRDTASPEPFRGLEGARQFYEMWSTAFPDFKLTLRNTIANETGIACELEFNGTNKGPITMPGQQDIPATNKKVIANKGSYFAKWSNGKLTEVSSYPDLAGMMAQLGLMQEQHAS
jgi:steroid delta-isomerase-like uncharacterized protein